MSKGRWLSKTTHIALWPLQQWRICAAALACMALLHIAVTFSIPFFARASAYERLASELPLNTMLYYPALKPDTQPLPFMSADVFYAICRFDTRRRPLQISAFLPEPGWTLTLYTRDGAGVYSAAGQKGEPITLNLQVVPSSIRFSGLTSEALGFASQRDRQQIVQAPRGIALIRAPDRGLAYREQVEGMLEKSNCFSIER
ncbi:MAG: hypothetical protein AAGG72_02620 [Pseudomonadota bacterium]